MMILAILVLVLFGAKKLPRFSQSLGRSMGEFRRAKEDFDRERPEPSEDERGPHDSVNRLLTLVFALSLIFLGLSFAMQIMVKH